MESNYLPLLAIVVSLVIVIAYARFQDSALAERLEARNNKRAWKRDEARILTIAHRGGEGIVKNGGFTLSWSGDTPRKGYAVSLPGNEAVFRPEDNLKWSYLEARFTVEWYAEQRYREVKENPRFHFGGWVDGNRLYLDLSIVVASKREAIRLGKLYKQLAIYDIEKGETIYL